MKKAKRKICMTNLDEKREVVMEQVSVEGDGDAGRIKVGQGVRAKKRPVADAESETVVDKVRRRGKCK